MSDSDQPIRSASLLSTSITGEITVALVIVVFMLFVVTLICYLRAKHYAGTFGAGGVGSHQVTLVPTGNSPCHALDTSVLKSLPITVFRSEDFGDDAGIECAVCLSELADGEGARLLPNCNHCFHVECIDMWFQSNSTCPLCREPVKVPAPVPVPPSEVVELPNLEKKLEEGSSSTMADSFVIEIPPRGAEGFSSLQQDSMKSPALRRLRSLRRLLSFGSKGAGCSCSPGCNIEQGGIAEKGI